MLDAEHLDSDRSARDGDATGPVGRCGAHAETTYFGRGCRCGRTCLARRT
jgi:hypothetical protein